MIPVHMYNASGGVDRWRSELGITSAGTAAAVAVAIEVCLCFIGHDTQEVCEPYNILAEMLER